MSDIFYSQVNTKIAQELDLRAAAGKTGRSTDQLNYMLSKIANVKLTAYNKDEIDESQIALTIGGRLTKNAEFYPSGKDGYLSRPSKRPGPVITGVTVNIADNARFQINTSVITLLVQDPEDLDIIEEVFFKPGRVVKLQVQHPPSAVLSIDPNLSRSQLLTSTKILEADFDKDLVDEFLKLDRIVFTGLVSNFGFKYNDDVTIEVTLTLTATAGTYPSADMGFAATPANTGIEINTAVNFYTLLSDTVNNIIDSNSGDSTNPAEIIIGTGTDQSILHGPITSTDESDRFITVAYLINQLNAQIADKLFPSKKKDNSLLYCNDQICFSNYYEHLVSADPSKILLWPGVEASVATNVYKSSDLDGGGRTAYLNVLPTTEGYYVNRVFEKFDTAGDPLPEETKLVGHPSRIYVNMDVIEEIVTRLTDAATEKEPFTVKQFLIEIGWEIGKQTGYAVQMALIQHPDIPDALLYYDTNYLGLNPAIPEYTIPVFSSKGKGSIVRDFKLNFELPAAFKTTLLALGGVTPSPTVRASYNQWLFSNTPDQQIKANEEFKKNHETNLNQLNKTKGQLGNDFDSTAYKESVQLALKGYLAYPDADIRESAKHSRPVWPMDLEFTIDGINGFIFGDVLFFRGLPKRYNEQFVFCIQKIKHTISDTGDWTTNISCFARPRLLEI
jgi:hypothetical protein